MGTRKLRGGMPSPKKASKVKTFDSIFQAINGTIAQLKAYLEANPESVKTIGIEGNTPLHFAVDTYLPSKVKLMLDACKKVEHNINIKNTAGNSPFLGLCEYSTDVANDKATFDIFMLFMGDLPTDTVYVDYNVQNAKGETAFMVFLQKNKITSAYGNVQVLFTKFMKASDLMDLNIQNTDSENVLFYFVRNNPNAIYGDQKNAIVGLLEHPIDVNVVNNKGETALYLLIVQYAIQDIQGILAIMDAFVNKGYEMNKVLIVDSEKRNAEINGMNYYGTTIFGKVMDYTISNGQGIKNKSRLLALNMLHRYQIDIDIKDPKKNTALHLASMTGDKNLFEAIIEYDADINAQNIDGTTALMFAAINNRVEIVKLLVEKKANTKLKNKEGKTAYDLARSDEIKQLLNPKAKLKDKPYKGFSKSDMEIYDALFENPKDWSICPVCLSFSERKEGCMIMGHDCAKQDIFYHKDLYKKYAFDNEYGNIVEWCTICGRVCKNHKHYALSLPEDLAKFAIVTPEMQIRMLQRGTGVYFEDANCIGLGGGGIEEKVARFRRLREYAGELQEQVGKINNNQARSELIEEIWKAPLFKTKKYKEILEKKKLNIGTNVFPERIANNVEEEKVYRNVPFPEERKYPIKMGTEPECVIQGAVDESVSVKYQFQHQDVDGGSNHNGMYICNEDIENYIEQGNKAFGTAEFAKCWLPSCTANIFPEEVEAIISKPIYEDYKKKFNKKFGVVVEEEEEEKAIAPLRVEIPHIDPNMLLIHQWVDEQIPIIVAEHPQEAEENLQRIADDPGFLEMIGEISEIYIQQFNVDDATEEELITYAVRKGYTAGLDMVNGLGNLVQGVIHRYNEWIRREEEGERGPPVDPNMLQVQQWVEEQIPILVAEHRERVERQLELIAEDPGMRDEIEDYIVQYIEEFNVFDDINEHDLIRDVVTKGYDAGLHGIYGLKTLVEGALNRYRDFIRRAAQAQRGPPLIAVAENAVVPEDPIVLQIEDWIDEQLPIIAAEHPEEVARQLEFIANNPLRIEGIIEGLINDYIDEAGGEERVPEALRGIIGYATTRGYKTGFLRESGLDTLVNAAVASFIDFDEAREAVRRQLGNNARGGARKKRTTRKKGSKGKKTKKEKRRKQRGGDFEHVFHKLDLDSAICLPFLKA